MPLKERAIFSVKINSLFKFSGCKSESFHWIYAKRDDTSISWLNDIVIHKIYDLASIQGKLEEY